MFYEGGNYSAEEAKILIGKLEILDKDITTELKNFLKDVDKYEMDLIKKYSSNYTETIAL